MLALVRPDASQNPAPTVRQLIAKEEASGTPSNRVVVAGFSQGAAVTLYTALTMDAPLAGIVGLSGYLPLPEQFTKEVRRVRGRNEGAGGEGA